MVEPGQCRVLALRSCAMEIPTDRVVPTERVRGGGHTIARPAATTEVRGGVCPAEAIGVGFPGEGRQCP